MKDAPPPGSSPAPGALPPGRTRGQLVAEVAAALGRVPSGATVVVAVSGGPDSTACAFLVAEARPDLTTILAHVRHGLRDDRHDVAAVRTQASWLGVDLEIVEVVVESSGQGIEAEARSQRYAALRRIARAHDAGWLLVGHTADDQAETLLLRLARGTGVPGLGGMAPVRGDVVRPLLRIRRVDLHRFVALEGLPTAHDPTNEDRRFARNRVRHDLVPVLESLGPDVVGALARLADLARDDARALDELAAARSEEVLHRLGPVVVVARDVLATGAPAVTRRVVRSMVLEVRGGVEPPTASEVEAIRTLAEGAMDLGGVVVTTAGGWTAVGPAELPRPDPRPMQVPGSTPWSVTRGRIDATTPDTDVGTQLHLGIGETWQVPQVRVDPRVLPPGADPALGQVVLGGLASTGGMQVRTRQPGDRVVTRAGTRKLQDVYVDAGVPRQLRDLLPIVVQGDQVLWVPGLVVDEEIRRAGVASPQVHLAVVRAGARRPG